MANASAASVHSGALHCPHSDSSIKPCAFVRFDYYSPLTDIIDHITMSRFRLSFNDYLFMYALLQDNATCSNKYIGGSYSTKYAITHKINPCHLDLFYQRTGTSGTPTFCVCVTPSRARWLDIPSKGQLDVQALRTSPRQP